jgi:methionine-rich copper-binding protein CopC
MTEVLAAVHGMKSASTANAHEQLNSSSPTSTGSNPAALNTNMT